MDNPTGGTITPDVHLGGGYGRCHAAIWPEGDLLTWMVFSSQREKGIRKILPKNIPYQRGYDQIFFNWIKMLACFLQNLGTKVA